MTSLHAQQTLRVDALNGDDSSNDPGVVSKSIRKAIAKHVASAPGTTSQILVVGRQNGGQVVLHNDAIEAWSSNGPLVLPDRVSIVWDQAGSDGGTTPVVLSGLNVPVGSSMAFSVSPTITPSRSSLQIVGLQVVAFETGLEWRPQVPIIAAGITLQNLMFNQCTQGVLLAPAAATNITITPLITGCRFDNAAQAVGGGRPTLTSLLDHVHLRATSLNQLLGDVENSTFTTNATTAGGAPISVGAGIWAEVGDGGTCAPTVRQCAFLGNATANPTPNGMMQGFFLGASGVVGASFLVANCYFANCSENGMTLLARGQGGIVMTSPGEGGGTGWNYDPPETHFLTPRIESSTFTANGFSADARGMNAPADAGHGISTRTFDFGQMQPTITQCDATGTSAGFNNLGIRGNARDGVWIHSNWFYSTTFPYADGAITFTRNDTWTEKSRIYMNGRHGIGVQLFRGSGNPGIKSNRIYHNVVAGVDVLVEGQGVGNYHANDRVVGTPVTWNNFIYGGTNALGMPPQPYGFTALFWQRDRGGLVPDTIGGIGVYHNTVVGNTVNGINVVANLAVSPSINSVQGNISYFNTGGQDLVITANVNNSYNCASNATPGNGNILLNPQLVNRFFGDLHLMAFSPCIDSVPNWPPSPPLLPLIDDIDGQARPNGAQFDMGADERY